MINDVKIKFKLPFSPVSILLPVSKSEYNRAAIISYLSNGKVQIQNHSDAKDSVKMRDLLSMISDGKSFYLDCGAAGTTFRFLVSVVAISYGEWTLTGSKRMKERPIQPLVDAFRNLGAEIQYTEKENYPPLLINGKNIEGGEIKIDAQISSQFISSLMMVAPLFKKGLIVHFNSKPVSFPYLKMTASLMKKCGADVELNENLVKISHQNYSACEINCEPDWSAASYFYAFVAVKHELKFNLTGLRQNSLQGDAIAQNIFAVFGVETLFTTDGIEIYNNQTVATDYFEFDFSDCPDLAQTLAFTCTALHIAGKLTGLSTLKNKETDRIQALKNELEKCGMHCETGSDFISFEPSGKIPSSVFFNTYEDHRMAMSATVVAWVTDEIIIENKEVVSKSFPEFWQQLTPVMK